MRRIATAESEEAMFEKLERSVNGVHFPYPVLLAGGVVKTVEQVRKLAPTDVIPMWGSITKDKSDGNGGDDYYAHYAEAGEHRILMWAENSIGLTNPGMDYVEKYAADEISRYKDFGKPLGLNVSSDGVRGLLSLMKRAVACGFKIITANGACPNKVGANSKPMPILCFDVEAVEQLVEYADREIGRTDCIILFKISAGLPRPTLARIKELIAKSVTFTGIAATNTLPNGFFYHNDGRTVIKTNVGNITRGGLSGPAIMPIALDHTQFLASDDWPKGKIVIGSGGICRPQDAMQFFRAGATLVKINTAFREDGEDPRFFTAFNDKLHALLEAT